MFDHKEIEDKWQKKWEQDQIYHAADDSGKPKQYVLIEFPYPSGEGLHMGHLRPFLAGDIYSRLKRMQGFETLYPMGWDAFGLPAENYAIKNKMPPAVSTAKNIANAKRQLKSWGIGFDWAREINTTDPDYYRWTQWIFLQFYKTGLAYEATGLINWCPKDKTGLANEEVIDGKCERCGTVVEKKEMKQWYLKITAYADKLLEGLKNLNWPDQVKTQQENWIGRSEGAEIDFELNASLVTELDRNSAPKGTGQFIKIFTTRPDTIFGATYMVLAPEHPLVGHIISKEQKAEVEKYIAETKGKSELQRTALEKEKTGVFTGAFAINPATKEKIPIWIADYVLASYGTGAIMAVPAHDERDFDFAHKFGLGVARVVNDEGDRRLPYVRDGRLMNSGKYNNTSSATARPDMAKEFGTPKVQYKLRDWVFSRQRYWGEPIPLIHCEKCGVVPVPDNELPVRLPEVENYEPTGTGESPLAAIESWVNVKCPKCEGPAKRETNTMPQWAGSSWYWLRYTDPHNTEEFASKNLQQRWTPVDVYFGGMEHTTLHLLYSRFWNLFLYDQGLVTTKEPYLKRIPHGIILGPDGEKMSKSRGNVINPDEIVGKFGADALRMFEPFLGPHGATVPWSDKGIMGVVRFLDRVAKFTPDGEDVPQIHKLIKKITEDIESYKFNTAIAAFMEFLNDHKKLSVENWKTFLILLAPFAPHLTEELWSQLGQTESIHKQAWPKFDEKLTIDANVTFVVQILGKVRGSIEMPAGAKQEEVAKAALADPKIAKYLEGKKIAKEIFVADKLINFVVAS